MTDAEVERIGKRYRAWVEETRALRYDVEAAYDAVLNGEADPGFGRDLLAALGRLETA